MNHSIYRADRTTHLKIVIIGLSSALMVAAVGTFSHVDEINLRKDAIAKSGQAMVFNERIR